MGLIADQSAICRGPDIWNESLLRCRHRHGGSEFITGMDLNRRSLDVPDQVAWLAIDQTAELHHVTPVCRVPHFTEVRPGEAGIATRREGALASLAMIERQGRRRIIGRYVIPGTRTRCSTCTDRNPGRVHRIERRVQCAHRTCELRVPQHHQMPPHPYRSRRGRSAAAQRA